MRISELEILIQALKDLGHNDSIIYYEDGRDGESALTPITARLKKDGVQSEEEILLIFHRGGKD